MKNKKRLRARHFPVYLPRDAELEAGFASLRKEGMYMGTWAARVIRERMQKDGLLPVTESK